MRPRLPALSIATWLGIVIGCIAPLFVLAIVTMAQWLDKGAFEQGVRTNLHATAFAVESNITLFLLTGEGGEEAVESIRRVVQPHSISVIDHDNERLLHDDDFQCDVAALDDLTAPLMIDQPPYLCVWVQVALGQSGEADSIYENNLFGASIGQERTDTEPERLGSVGLAFRNSGWVKSKLLIAELAIILATVGLCIYGIKRVVGKRLNAVVECIRGRRYDDLQSLMDSDRVPVSELRLISSAYLEQERGATDLKAGLLRAGEQEEAVALEMAAEIHDNLCAKLNMLKREVEASAGRSQDDGFTERTERWVDLIDGIDSAARRIIKRSSSDVIDILGIEAGLRELVAGFEDPRITFAYRVECDIAKPLHRPIARIIQEAINNAIKHANCTKIRVSVVQDEDDTGGDIVVSIKDDGVGMTASTAGDGSMGILLMRERAQRIGAQLEFSSNTDGTTVRLICQDST